MEMRRFQSFGVFENVTNFINIKIPVFPNGMLRNKESIDYISHYNTILSFNKFLVDLEYSKIFDYKFHKNKKKYTGKMLYRTKYKHRKYRSVF